MSKSKRLTKTDVKNAFKRTLFDPTTGPMKVVIDIDNEQYYAQRAYENLGMILANHVPTNMEPEEAKLSLIREALVMLHLCELKLNIVCDEKYGDIK